MHIRTPRFGNQYPFTTRHEAEVKQADLAVDGIASAMAPSASRGVLQVMGWTVYTDEGDTKDLTEFRANGGKDYGLF